MRQTARRPAGHDEPGGVLVPLAVQPPPPSPLRSPGRWSHTPQHLPVLRPPPPRPSRCPAPSALKQQEQPDEDLQTTPPPAPARLGQCLSLPGSCPCSPAGPTPPGAPPHPPTSGVPLAWPFISLVQLLVTSRTITYSQRLPNSTPLTDQMLKQSLLQGMYHASPTLPWLQLSSQYPTPPCFFILVTATPPLRSRGKVLDSLWIRIISFQTTGRCPANPSVLASKYTQHLTAFRYLHC